MDIDQDIPTFKCVLLGEGGTGKTTFVKRHVLGDQNRRYIKMMAVEIHPVQFSTSKGPVQFDVWDTAGQEKLGSGLRDSFYAGAHCGIIMFDVNKPATQRQVPEWYGRLLKARGDVPVVLCGNKADLKRDVTVAMTTLPTTQSNFKYFNVSAKSNYNFEKPFLHLARRLLKDPLLNFVSLPQLLPPEVRMNMNIWERNSESEAKRNCAGLYL